MKRVSWKWIAITAWALCMAACANEGVGDPCVPESIPCDDPTVNRNCGFRDSESYIESSSVQCRSRLCIVHKLKGRGGNTLADPRDLEGKDEGVDWNPDEGGTQTDGPSRVGQQDLDQSVYCTCRCNAPKETREFCECPSGYKCEEVLTLGGEGIKGSYCVRPAAE
jgi:hypothetical protein